MKLFESALDYDLCREILKEAQHGFEHNPMEWISSHTFWNEYIINDSRPVMIRKLNRKYYDVVLDQLLSKLIIPVLPDNMQYEVLSYMWPVTGNIPWHFDGDDRVTATLYLNEEWLKE